MSGTNSHSLQQNIIDVAIEWRKQLKACMHADGQHFELIVHETEYGQLQCNQLCLFLKKMFIYC